MWQHGTGAGELAGETREENPCSSQGPCLSERLHSCRGLQDRGEAEAAGVERPADLRLSLVPCRGVFTTADSPMSQRLSPREKLAFPQEQMTHELFSAVTTTADEAFSHGACGNPNRPADLSNPIAVAAPHKALHAVYPQNYYCCRALTTHREDASCTPASCSAFSTEETHLGSQPSNKNLQEAEPRLPAGELTPQTQADLSNAPPPVANHLPAYAAGAPPSLLHPAEGTPKGPDTFLQFRPFANQQPAHFEASLGEELLSVARYSCSFVTAAGQTAQRQIQGDVAPYLFMDASSNMLLEQEHLEVNASGAHTLSPQLPAWRIDSPVGLHKVKENSARAGGSHIKAEGGVGFGRGFKTHNEEEVVRRLAPLPWVVVRPHEDEEKAFTQLSTMAVDSLLQRSATNCTYVKQPAN